MTGAIVTPDTIAVTVFARDHDGEMFRATGLTEENILAWPEVGAELPVAAIYEGIARPYDRRPINRA